MALYSYEQQRNIGKRMNTQATITHIAKPADSRCAWWQAEIPNTLSIDDLKEKNVKLEYYKRGQDLELPIGTMIIDSEANHHRNNRGFTVNLGLVTSEGMRWICPTLEIKKFIKTQGHTELMVGSGDVCGAFRIALYLREQEDMFEAFKTLCAQ